MKGLKSQNEEIEAKELPEFDDLLDWIDFVDNNDMGEYLDSMEEVSPEQFNQESNERRAAWKAMPRKQKKRVTLGENIRTRLLVLQMRQSELATRLGKDRAWVSRVVSGQENPTLETLTQLAVALECEEHELLADAPPSSTRSSFPVRVIKARSNVLPFVARERFKPAAVSCGDDHLREAA